MSVSDPASGPCPTDTGSALIDREHLATMTGGDTALAQEVIDIFRQQAEIWSRLLDPHVPPQHWADAAHSLKGAALSLGAQPLAAACKTAEELGRRDPPPSLTEGAVALSEVKDRLGEALEAAAHLAHEIDRTGAL